MGRSDGKEGQGKVIKVMKDADSKDSLSVVVRENTGRLEMMARRSRVLQEIR